MSNCVGESGVFGIRLDQFGGSAIGVVVKEIGDYWENMREELAENGEGPEEVDAELTEKFGGRLREVLYQEQKISVPAGAVICWTGSEDDRASMGRPSTPADIFVFGFGMYAKPWEWEDRHKASQWDASFRNVADMWTWSWSG